MKKSPWLKENWFKISILVIIAITGLAITYHYLIYIPQEAKKNEIRENNKQIQYDLYRQKLFECLGTAINQQGISDNEFKDLKNECYKEFDARIRSSSGLFIN